MICTRCGGTGFLNYEQLPETKEPMTNNQIIKWIKGTQSHDVQVCDCCGNGEDCYGVAGQHYTKDDPPGDHGPYSYNGGLCECH